MIYQEVDKVEGRNFAVIVDEAHSFQTGSSAIKLKTALADTEAALREYAEIEGKAEDEIDRTDILDAFQPFYQETFLEQEVNVDLIYQTERELLNYAIYTNIDIEAFIEVWNKSGGQESTSMGKMTSVLKPVADRYNLKNSEERYQFRRLVRNFIKWYGYITQVVRMFDTDMHKECPAPEA